MSSQMHETYPVKIEPLTTWKAVRAPAMPPDYCLRLASLNNKKGVTISYIFRAPNPRLGFTLSPRRHGEVSMRV